MKIDAQSFLEIAPYDGTAFREALDRVLAHPRLNSVVAKFFPKLIMDEFMKLGQSLTKVEEFQKQIIAVAIHSILKRTSNGLKVTGLESKDPSQTYLYISNHRNIIADSALLAVSQAGSGFRTCNICLGDNLLKDPFVTDLVKINKGITVKRDLSQRELFKWSKVLSAYIRFQISEKKDSVWIAQREGRAKDGNDETHPGILKMLALSGTGDFLERIRHLRIVPTAISYEWDPCDAHMARELFLTDKEGAYTKAPHEDFKSLAEGITGVKGGIHLAIGELLKWDESVTQLSKIDQVRKLCTSIDDQIQKLYKIWPSNEIAYAAIIGSSSAKEKYSSEQIQYFETRMQEQIGKVTQSESEAAAIRPYFLRYYARPVFNLKKEKLPSA